MILLILTSITLITLDTRGGDGGVGGTVRNAARDVFAPIQDGVDKVVSPIQNWWDGVTRAGSIKDRNRELKRELQAARGDLATARAAIAQVRAIKALAELPFAADLPGVDAQIILGSPGNFESTVGLNKGTDHGLAVDQPVVSGRGLLGRVARASGRRSTVLLLTDRDSGVYLRDESSGATGVLNGRPDAELQSMDVDVKTEMKRGDLLLTVGSAVGPFPPDVPVARVVEVQKRKGDLLARVSVRLLADANTTEFVRILQWPVQP